MNVHISKNGAPKLGRPSRMRLFEQLSAGVQELWTELGGLPTPSQAQEIWNGIWLEEAHNSTAIEGNTLILKQVAVLLAEGRAVGGKELREYAEVKGYADAADWVYKQAVAPKEWSDGSILTMTEVRAVHEMAMTAVWEIAPHPAATPNETPGKFREHEIHAFPDGMQPVSWVNVFAELTSWIRSVNAMGSKAKKDAVFRNNLPEDLARLHCRFEQIHPFLDGNGRTGRLLLNLILARIGYPPAIIYKRQRPKYLQALRNADAEDFGTLSELLARAILDNLYRFVVPAVAKSDRLVPLHALATKELNAGALRTAANRGRLQAARDANGQWRSTRKWVDAYIAQRYERN